MEHTPKNILIRGVKKGEAKSSEDCRKIMDFLQVTPTLAVLQDIGKEDRQDAQKHN